MKKRVSPKVVALGISLSLSSAVLALGMGDAKAAPIPAGWGCVGNCGSDGADGVVTNAPVGAGNYEWVSTAGGAGISGLAGVGTPANGSTLVTPLFSAGAGDILDFYFNYVTSDGSGYADYAWARLLDESSSQVALLFTARTLPSGNIVPGSGMPTPEATLLPPSVPIIPGGPSWSPLAGSSGACFDAGCGYTGWVESQYVIASSGNYMLEFGVGNWSDTSYDSGLAIAGVTIGGTPIGTVPEPASLVLLGTAVLGARLVRRRRST